jgi:hypothetical protein
MLPSDIGPVSLRILRDGAGGLLWGLLFGCLSIGEQHHPQAACFQPGDGISSQCLEPNACPRV